MVRKLKSSTIISFHPEGLRSTAAKHLQSRILDAGNSVYWKDILEHTKDPTFILLIYLWYALYAWDQALEDLYKYISEMVSIEPSLMRSNPRTHRVDNRKQRPSSISILVTPKPCTLFMHIFSVMRLCSGISKSLCGSS
jgi:hypothetical protein